MHNGTVWSVGSDSHGQLGRSGSNASWGDTGQPANSVAAGIHSGYFLGNSTYWVIGNNLYGKLGLGDQSTRYNFTEMTPPE
ncbi:hypothetical protein [Neptuniibacter sp. QD37_11]|uniref:hypothetical protein n=1 Tax=Neptuniibacter sp. QD37_11 TaxID=3398209 RepID=UPI0039F5A0ED